jgi:hypothetical protein
VSKSYANHVQGRSSSHGPCERSTWRDGARFATVRDAGARFFGLGFEIFHCHTSGSKIRLSSLALPPSVSEFASQSCDPHKNPLRVFIGTEFRSTEGGRKEEAIPATRPPVTCSPPRLPAGPRRPDRVLARWAARDIRRHRTTVPPCSRPAPIREQLPRGLREQAATLSRSGDAGTRSPSSGYAPDGLGVSLRGFSKGYETSLRIFIGFSQANHRSEAYSPWT